MARRRFTRFEKELLPIAIGLGFEHVGETGKNHLVLRHHGGVKTTIASSPANPVQARKNALTQLRRIANGGTR